MKVILDSYRISELRGEKNLPPRGRVFETAYVTAPEENKSQTAIIKKKKKLDIIKSDRLRKMKGRRMIADI